MSVYWYFVSFSFVSQGKRAWGNTEVPLPTRVSSIEDVRLMQYFLEYRYGGDVLIMYYSLLRVDEDAHETILTELRMAQAILQRIGRQDETVSTV